MSGDTSTRIIHEDDLVVCCGRIFSQCTCVAPMDFWSADATVEYEEAYLSPMCSFCTKQGTEQCQPYVEFLIAMVGGYPDATPEPIPTTCDLFVEKAYASAQEIVDAEADAAFWRNYD